MLNGGDGNDVVDGNGGADTVTLGSGDDRFVWDPGDGSDVVDGGDGHDAMAFNGSAAAEQFHLSAQWLARAVHSRRRRHHDGPQRARAS